MNTTSVAVLAGGIGTLLGAAVSNWQKNRLHKKEIISEATKSALERVEMYYRILRRTENETDQIEIRNKFHSIQEKNDYYRSLLSIEAPWLGECYRKFIEALKRETMAKIQSAWDGKPYGPGAKLKDTEHPETQKYYHQFTKDSRRLFNPLMRILMHAKYILRRYIKNDGYGL